MSSGIRTDIQFEPGEVLQAEITFPHQEAKRRPVLVISKHSSIKYDPPSTVFICVPITSVESKDQFTFKVRWTDIVPTLPKQSYVLSNYVFTVDLMRNRLDQKISDAQ